MNIIEVLEQVRKLLQQQGRLSYRILKLQFELDDEQLEALKEELIEVQEGVNPTNRTPGAISTYDKEGRPFFWQLNCWKNSHLADGDSLPKEVTLSDTEGHQHEQTIS